ncbi:hypothetical protein HN789_06295 [archaeon]|jgi:hypothetical protein|nr:hypothetical protein [archaeon]MBT4022379.1 hypothetical protein [archaeon]MBT4273257.1 hypothetical protein [archaeon]MBT4461300.1 hypothetical protein [archaeon]MBT4858688.1 hypothetical protein [archaeon]
MKKIKDYFLNKLFFPKVALIETPGIILSKTTRKYSKHSSLKRIIFDFENIIIEIYKTTTKKIGKKKTSKLWYEIGKDVGTMYFSFSKNKKIPKSLIPNILEYIIKNLQVSGGSGLNTFKFDMKNKTLMLSGKSNAYCRKTADASMTAGLMSGIFSFFMEENIEANALCKNCPDNCKIFLSPKIKEKYIPQKILNNVETYELKQKTPTKGFSFQDFVKFKKIKINEDGKNFFENFLILPTSPRFLDLIIKKYQDNNLENELNLAIRNSTNKIGKTLFNNQNNNQSLQKLQHIYSAFGWGHVDITKGKKLIINVDEIPFSKQSENYFISHILGFLDCIYAKKIKFENIKRYNTNSATLSFCP